MERNEFIDKNTNKRVKILGHVYTAGKETKVQVMEIENKFKYKVELKEYFSDRFTKEI